jgi:hypothetical protein
VVLTIDHIGAMDDVEHILGVNSKVEYANFSFRGHMMLIVASDDTGWSRTGIALYHIRSRCWVMPIVDGLPMLTTA